MNVFWSAARKDGKIRRILFGIGGVILILGLVLAAWYFLSGGFSGTQTVPDGGYPEIAFHFIDVGQGDAAVICTPDGNILIDAGKNEAEEDLRAYLERLGIKDIEYAIFTHPHEDHIGGADMVIKEFGVKRAILPNCVTTSGTYTRMLEAFEEQHVEVIEAKADFTFEVGRLKCTLLGPNSPEYDSINDYSVIMRVDYGDTSILYTGDAEMPAEAEILERYGASGLLDCDLLKVGHHGSDTSTTQELIDAVTPAYGVVSVGDGNGYGHPSMSVLTRLQKNGVTVFRTDVNGSIVFTSTGGEPVQKKP